VKTIFIGLLVIVIIGLAIYQYTQAEMLNEQAKQLILSVMGR